jgi:O-antigen/teichoic acid export membrane protein
MLKHRTKALASYGAILFVFQIAFVVVPVILGYGLHGAIMGLVVMGGLKFLVLCVMLLRHTKPALDIGFLKEHLHLAWPLALSIFVSGSGDLVDGYLVSSHFDRATFAIFRYGARELPIAVLLANAFSSSVVPKVAEDLQSALLFIKSRSRQMMHLLFPLSIILLLTSRYFYPIVFRPGFAGSAVVFNIFLLLLVTRMMFPQTILNGLKQTRIILASTIVELALNISISVFLMPHYGIIGIAWGTVIAYFIDKVVLVSYNYYHNHIPPTKYIDFKIIGLYTVLLYAAYVFSLYC